MYVVHNNNVEQIHEYPNMLYVGINAQRYSDSIRAELLLLGMTKNEK